MNGCARSASTPTSPVVRRTVTLARELVGFPAASVAACRRLRADARAAGRNRADRPRRDGGPHLHRVGQGRHRRARHHEGRCAGARACSTCIRKRFRPAGRHAGIRSATSPTSRARIRRVYDMLQRGDSHRRVPGRKPRADEHAAAAAAAQILRSGHRGGDRAARADPGRHGASLSAPPRRAWRTVEFPSPAPEHGPPDELQRVLGRTLGVPLFQEQAMRIAIEAAKFTPEEANALRRAMATFRNVGTIDKFFAKMVDGMVARGYERDFAERCFQQIEGLRHLRFSREPRRELRAAGLCLGLAEMPPSRRPSPARC